MANYHRLPRVKSICHELCVIVLLGILASSCNNQKGTDADTLQPFGTVTQTLEIPNILIDKSKLEYDRSVSQWSLDGNLFSGYAVSYYTDTIIAEKIGILDGKKQNEFIQYFADGHPKHASNYHLGKLHGSKKSWSSDSSHILLSHLNYATGKLHGEQKKWYPTGELFKKLNMNMGREEGIQQAYRKNGKLFANYEAKSGRIFGLKKASLCYGIEDQTVKYEK